MLELKKITKSYTTGEFTQYALKGIDLVFRKSEFVAILGPSGSGKTTLLNMIGGLDRYDNGDLLINNKSTRQFKDTEWDAYRNNCVGFIFQNYNLISHISVLANVEMGMTLSGVSKEERHQKAKSVLERVGLKDHIHKKPNQLSGGQMQRVAIARALANDPDIILADEPTGALDSETSVQIMNLIKEIAKDKLVIMVTHNDDLANEYASRIVELKDGELVGDSDPITKEEKKQANFNIRKTAMSFLTALKLSFNNIITKTGRTVLTAFASSIGIIGIALILSLSNGFDIQIKQFEESTLSSLPVIISEQSMQMDEDTMKKMQDEMIQSQEKAYTNEQFIYPQKSHQETMMHANNLNKEYVDYIEKMDPSLIAGISYTHATALNLITNQNGVYKPVLSTNINMSLIPWRLDETTSSGVIDDNYDILKGRVAKDKNELVIIVDSNNNLLSDVFTALGLDPTKEKISFDDMLGKEIKLVYNEEYYQSLGNHFTLNTNYEEMYNSDKVETLKVVGIIRGKEDKKLVTGGSGIGYTNALIQEIIQRNQDSAIVKLQQEKDYNVLTGEKIDLSTSEGQKTKDTLLSYLGADKVPMAISIFPKNFDAKDSIITYLDKYNEGKETEDKIIYTDMAEMITSLSGDIMSAVTIVLIAFSAISLVVSSIMIGIITYISVLERTKEIGVLRSLGARKKDIQRVFTAETFIIGMTSGILGILIACVLIVPANIIIEALTNLPNVAQLNPLHALILIIISVLLTIIGGAIPAKIASKKDPVIALRTE